jgi:ApaG protein
MDRMPPMNKRPLGSEAVTDGIRVRVEPAFLDSHSDIERGNFTFAYKIHLTNEGTMGARLLGRYWRIVDADGHESVVEGPGVVGQHPHLEPGQTFEYSSFCPLKTSWGTMEGHFIFERADGETFRATVDRFYLACPEARAASRS